MRDYLKDKEVALNNRNLKTHIFDMSVLVVSENKKSKKRYKFDRIKMPYRAEFDYPSKNFSNLTITKSVLDIIELNMKVVNGKGGIQYRSTIDITVNEIIDSLDTFNSSDVMLAIKELDSFGWINIFTIDLYDNNMNLITKNASIVDTKFANLNELIFDKKVVITPKNTIILPK